MYTIHTYIYIFIVLQAIACLLAMIDQICAANLVDPERINVSELYKLTFPFCFIAHMH